MIKACIDQFTNERTTTPGNPYQQLSNTMAAHTILPGSSYRESTYGLGWIRTELPNQMYKISPNVGMIGTAPVVGVGAPSKLVIAHYGSMPGSYSGVNLFPETQSAIVVLINTTPRCDLADWMTQLLAQTLFDFPTKNDYIHWIQRTVNAELDWHSRIASEMERQRKKDTSPRQLDEYIGSYWNSAKTLLISITFDQRRLHISFEGLADETFPMTHYEDDIFSWLQPRNALVKRARTVGQAPSYYMIRFETDNNSQIARLFWTHDTQLPMGEMFVKDSMTSSDSAGYNRDEL